MWKRTTNSNAQHVIFLRLWSQGNTPESKLVGERRWVKGELKGPGVHFLKSHLKLTVIGTLNHVLAEKSGGPQGKGCQ